MMICPNCESVVFKNCEYMFHDKKCANCLICWDCKAYEEEVENHYRMINSPDYFFEPYYPGETPDDIVPLPPKKRIDDFEHLRKGIKTINKTVEEHEVLHEGKKITWTSYTIDLKFSLYFIPNAELRVYYSTSYDELEILGQTEWKKIKGVYTDKVIEQFKAFLFDEMKK